MLCHKAKIFLLFTVCLSLMIISSAYSKEEKKPKGKKLTCDDIKDLFTEEKTKTETKLEKRIFSVHNQLPLAEIAVDNQGPNASNHKYWTEEYVCCKEGCAAKLGRLFAKIVQKNQYDSLRLEKVVQFILKTLQQFKDAQFITSGATTYDEFINIISNNRDDYETLYLYKIKIEKTKDLNVGIQNISDFRERIKNKNNEDKLDQAITVSEANNNAITEINGQLETLKNKFAPLPQQDLQETGSDNIELAKIVKNLKTNKIFLIGCILILFLIVLLSFIIIRRLRKSIKKYIKDKSKMVNEAVSKGTITSLQDKIDKIKLGNSQGDGKQYNDDLKEEIKKELNEFSKNMENKFDDKFSQYIVDIKVVISSEIQKSEKEITEKKWEKLKENHQAIIDQATDLKEKENTFFEETLKEDLVALFTDFDKSTASKYNSILTEINEYYKQMMCLAMIHNYFESPEAHPEQDIDTPELRSWSELLSSLQSSRKIRKMLNFKLAGWIRSDFLEVADMFLREYLDRKQEKSDDSWDELNQIVLDVLAKADLKPVEIELGKTNYNSKKHIARSSISNNSLPDKVITGIIRNGFMQKERVIQQPQVTINKV